MNKMVKALALVGLVSLGGPIVVDAAWAGAHDQEIADARKAAETWLALADAGDGAGTHRTAAAYFRNAVSEDAWVKALSASRGPLGDLSSRTFTNAQYATTLPGAPDGEYVVLTYTSAFANKAKAVETITPMREADGSWRVSGYYIK